MKSADVVEHLKGNAQVLMWPLLFGAVGLYFAGVKDPKAWAYMAGGAILGMTGKAVYGASKQEAPPINGA